MAVFQCILLWITALQFSEMPQGRRTVQQPDLRCGAYCLYIGLKALDLPVKSFEDLEERLGPATAAGYSMDQLQTIAQQFGAKTLPVETTLDSLERRQRPFISIAHLTTGHFVLIGDIKDGKVFIINPPGGSYELPVDTFLSQWSNRVLLVSRTQLTLEEDLSRPSSMWWISIGCVALTALGVAVWFWMPSRVVA